MERARARVVASCGLLAALLSGTRGLAADGEGSARLLPEGDFVAGSVMRMEVEVTVGPTGIATGGGVAVLFHHIFREMQTTAPEREGYVTVDAGAGSTFELTWHPWVPRDAFPKGEGIYRHGVIATVRGRALAAGETVRFAFGAGPPMMRWPIVTDRHHEVRVHTDVDGDGKFGRVASELVNDVLAGPTDHLWVTVPSTAAVGETVDIAIRAEDAFGNLAETTEAQVTVTGMAGLPAEGVRLRAGLARLTVPAAQPGMYRVTAAAETPALRGRSNPVVVTQEAPRYRVFWGDIHGHTQNSDGLGETADEYYAYARDRADLDVCALTDHGLAHLEKARQAVKDCYEPGRFVTFLGWEWDARSAGHGDKCLYLLNPDDAPPKGWPRSAPALWEALQQAYGDNAERRIITGPHMFTYPDALGWPEVWNPAFERFVEVYSGHGMSEYPGNPRALGGAKPGATMQEALARGLRFGVIGSSDNHDSHPGRHCWGRYRGGLVAFLAESLTRESIWDALWNRRVYAATTDRIYFDFRIDGHPMGEEFAATGPPAITYAVHGCTDELTVFVIKNNVVLRQATTTDGTVQETFTDDDFTQDSYYYLRVVQANDECAWSSPIWVNGAA
jgi:hypothetical protein